VRKFKHKLNMLEPGIKMIKVIGVLIVLSILLKILHFTIIYYLCVGMSGLIGIILFILLLIEHHQDEILNRQALQERKKYGDE
jgi:hypothetical protein